MRKRSRQELHRLAWMCWVIVIAVLIADQVLKFWVKTHMQLGESIPLLGSWANLHFVENNGIAFGMELKGTFGKLLLSLIRIVLVVLMVILTKRLFHRGRFPKGVLVGLMLIIAGALGNIIDGTFYGLLFSSSESVVLQNGNWVQAIAEFLPESGGYAPIFHGKVVDMLYFPLFSFTWPSWIPGIGNTTFLFFQPVFNLADASITSGVLYLLLFKSRFLFSKDPK